MIVCGKSTMLFFLILVTTFSSVLSQLPANSAYRTRELAKSKYANGPLPGTEGERARRIPPYIEPLHYYIQVTPYFENDYVQIPAGRNMTFDGKSTLLFRVKESTRSITLHSFNLNYTNIDVFDSDGLPLMTDIKPQFNLTLNHIIIPLNFDTVIGNMYMVQFKYIGGIHDYLDNGIYYTYYDEVGGKRHYMLATHMEPARARWVFPCLDEPAYKAVFHLTLIYPSGYIALANSMERTAVPMKKSGPGEGWEEIQFPPSLKMSTYLVAFAVGPYVKRQTTSQDGILIRIWGWTGQEEYLQWAAEVSAKCIYSMGQYTNFKYPYIKSDQLGLPQFVAGAMENYGLIIYKYQFISFNDKIHNTFVKQNAAKVICHELAHQWFGDTVTAMWWDDLFLQEGFATFFQRFNMQLALPEQKKYIDQKFLTQIVQKGLDADDILIQPSHPLYYYDGPAFDDVTYQKGGSVLHMIQSVLGPENFRTALQNYIHKYKFSNANHQMLFEEFTKAAGNVRDWCGRPLNATEFLNPWFLQQEFPLITLTNNQLMAPATLTQQPFNDRSLLPASTVYNYSWPVPLFWQNYMSSYVSPTSQLTWMPPAYEKCPGAGTQRKIKDDLHWEVGNAELSCNVRVQYDDIGYARMFNRISTHRDEDFSLADQIMLLGDRIAFHRKNMMKNEPFSYKHVIDMIKVVVPNSPNFGPFDMASGFLKPIEDVFMDGPDYVLFKRSIQLLLKENYDLLGVQGTGDWNNDIARLTMLPYMVRYEVGSAWKDTFALFEDFLKDCGQSTTGVTNCTKVIPDIRSPVYCAGARYGDQQAFDTLKKLYDQQVKYDFYFYTEYYAMLEGMSCSERKKDIFDTITRALTAFRMPSGSYRVPVLFYIVSNPKGSQWMAEYLLQNKEAVIASGNFEEYIDAMTSTWYSQQRHDQLHDMEVALNLPTDQLNMFDEFLNRTAEQVVWWKKYFPLVSRVYYDDFVIGPFEMENWQVQVPRLHKPTSYDLKIRPHFPGSAQYPWYQNLTFDGHVDIHFTVLRDTSQIVLDSHRMVIEAANMKLVHDATNFQVQIEYIAKDLVNAMLYMTVNGKMPAGSNWTLSIDYTGFIFGEPSKGVYTNTNYFEFNDQKAWIFSTYFESGPSARSLAPCFDEPSYKARWHVSLDHPADMIALGNMPRKHFTVGEEGWANTEFEATPPMSSYLLAVAVGHFASLETVSETGHLVRAWAWAGMEGYAQHGLKAVVGQVDFMSSYFDYPFPLPKLDVLALPQYTTMKGAEEHWGLIHIAYKRELVDPLYATAATYLDVASVCAHETVHQWFGDLVTIEFWPVIFLNEGFANYWETNGVALAFPEQWRYTKFERYRKGLKGFAVDSSVETSKPVIPDGPKYFTGIPYNKGASLLNMLNHAIHPEVLQAGLKTYLRKYQFSNTNDVDLWTELTKAAAAQGLTNWEGKTMNVSELMDPWTKQATYPVLKLTATSGTVTYSQEPYIKNTSALQSSPYGFLWTIPVFTQTKSGGKDNIDFHYFHGKTGSNSYWTRPLTDEWHVENPGFRGFYRIWYDIDTWTPILKQLQTDPNVFDELTRAQFLSDAVALQKRGSLGWDRVLDIVLTLQKETELAGWYTFRDTMNLFTEMFQNTDLWDNFKMLVGKIVNERYNTLGWKKTADWSYDTVAHYITEWACLVDHGDCRRRASDLFKNFIINCERSQSGTGRCNEVAPDERMSQYCWGTHENPDTKDVITTMYRWFEKNSKYFDRDSANLLNGMACTTNMTRTQILIEESLTGALPSDVITYLGDRDESRELLWDHFTSNTNDVIYGVVDTQTYMLAAMKKWNTDADVRKAQLFLERAGGKLSKDDKAAILAGIDSAKARIKWLSENKPAIAAWFSKNAHLFKE